MGDERWGLRLSDWIGCCEGCENREERKGGELHIEVLWRRMVFIDGYKKLLMFEKAMLM